MHDLTEIPTPAPRRRASTIRRLLNHCALRFSDQFDVNGPVDASDLWDEQGVYLTTEAQPGGLWKPVRSGVAGDVAERVQTICEEDGYGRILERFFVVYVSDLDMAGFHALEKTVTAAVGLPDPRRPSSTQGL